MITVVFGVLLRHYLANVHDILILGKKIHFTDFGFFTVVAAFRLMVRIIIEWCDPEFQKQTIHGPVKPGKSGILLMDNTATSSSSTSGNTAAPSSSTSGNAVASSPSVPGNAASEGENDSENKKTLSFDQ